MPRDGNVQKMSGASISDLGNRYCRPSGKIERTQRFPIYSDEELKPWFAEIAAGYCYKQAADRCLYVREWILNTMYSDDDVSGYMLDLSMQAGARIRAGEQEPPNRYDGLYNQELEKWHF